MRQTAFTKLVCHKGQWSFQLFHGKRGGEKKVIVDTPEWVESQNHAQHLASQALREFVYAQKSRGVVILEARYGASLH